MKIAVIALLVGCTNVEESPHDTSLGRDECDDIAAGGGWKNDFLPQSISTSEYVFTAVPIESSGRPIDAVIGFSDGRADAFADLGPIVRFNPSGFIDARNGSRYEASEPLQYRIGETYNFQITPDVSSHVYSVWAWRVGDDFHTRIATDFAFRSEQAAVPRLDNIGRKIDSTSGTVRICNFQSFIKDQYILSHPEDGWQGVTFPVQRGRFRAEFDAAAAPSNTDGVIGLSSVMPRYFSDLAAIVRFNPAGYIDVRDGSTYRYDEFLAYTGGTYHFVFDVDVAAKRYSVTAHLWDQPERTHSIATDYAFRTEQQGVSSLGVLGQINDSVDGYVFSEYLMISY